MGLDPQGLERLIPDYVQSGDTTGQETLTLHVARYEFAAKHVLPGRLLDIACGVGYGTRLIANRRRELTAVGVDCSEAAIAYASERYGDQRVRVLVGDANRFEDPEGFDSIVSLETIEHLPQPESFIAHVVSQLRPGGVFVASVPTTPSVDANPHHLNDFTKGSFRRMVAAHGLQERACFRQVQPFRVLPLLTRTEARAKEIRRNLPLYYLRNPGSMARRVASTLRFGFANHYITIAWRAQY